MKRTTPAPEDATAPPTDPLDYEEDDAYAQRVRLGLRPIHYKNDTIAGDHPDKRPCPSWCWVAEAGEDYGHEVLAAHPMVAIHSTESVAIIASAYPGTIDSGDQVASTATWALRLSQYSSRTEPSVMVALRSAGDYKEKMRLSIDDAREMVTVLTYLVAQADAEAELQAGREHNAFKLGVDAHALGLIEPSQAASREAT